MLVIVLSMSALLVLCAAIGWRRRLACAPGARSSSAAAPDADEHIPECGNAAQGQALAAFYAYQLGSARARAWQ